jgi:hypothetical protein
MAYSNADKAMALSLWLAGKDYRDIEEQTGIHRNTLINWANDGDWEKRKEEHLSLMEKTAIQDIADFKLDMIKQLETLREALIDDFKLSKNPTKDKIVSNIIEINKQILLIRGIPTEISKTENRHKIETMVRLEDLV